MNFEPWFCHVVEIAHEEFANRKGFDSDPGKKFCSFSPCISQCAPPFSISLSVSLSGSAAAPRRTSAARQHPNPSTPRGETLNNDPDSPGTDTQLHLTAREDPVPELQPAFHR